MKLGKKGRRLGRMAVRREGKEDEEDGGKERGE